MDSKNNKIRKVMTKIYGAIAYISLVAVLFAMMITTIDVILSIFVNIRILGNSEMVQMAMVIMMMLTFGKTQLEEGHVRVDMFTNKFPPKIRCAVYGCICAVSAFVSLMMTVQQFKQISTYYASGTGTSVLHIPYWPFSIVNFVGMALLCAAFILNVYEYFRELPHAKPIEARA